MTVDAARAAGTPANVPVGRPRRTPYDQFIEQSASPSIDRGRQRPKSVSTDTSRIRAAARPPMGRPAADSMSRPAPLRAAGSQPDVTTGGILVTLQRSRLPGERDCAGSSCRTRPTMPAEPARAASRHLPISAANRMVVDRRVTPRQVSPRCNLGFRRVKLFRLR